MAANPSIDLHNHLGYWETKGIQPAMKVPVYQGDDSTRDIVRSMIDARCKSAWICLTSDNAVVNIGVPGNKVRDYEDNEARQEYER